MTSIKSDSYHMLITLSMMAKLIYIMNILIYIIMNMDVIISQLEYANIKGITCKT